MSQRHLKAGDTLPPLTEGTLRLYSMHFCPYAQRARLVLAHKNITHEFVNVHLKKKPNWFLEKNPQGKVPVLEQDGKVIVESAICMDYLEDQYPGNDLYPKDPYEKAKAKMKMEVLSNTVSAFYKLWFGPQEETPANLEKLGEEFSNFNKLIDGKFLQGDNVTMADYFIWPWIERTPLMTAQLGFDIIDKEQYPKLAAWRDAMLEVPAVKQTVNTMDSHLKFAMSYKTGAPDYDFLF